jgi:hypothetical protein
MRRIVAGRIARQTSVKYARRTAGATRTAASLAPIWTGPRLSTYVRLLTG